jgi:hypothetical protein
MSRGRLLLLTLSLLLIHSGFGLYGEEYRESSLRTGALITGSIIGTGVITFYSFGPYSGFDFKEAPGASILMVGTSSSIMMSTAILHSNFLAKSVYKKENSILGAGLKGLWTGALCGGVSNGLAFAGILGIGVPSGVIEFNDPTLNGWQAAGTGFLGGFLYGALFGALIGTVEGVIFGAVLNQPKSE